MKKKLQNNIQLMCNDHQIVICGRGEFGGGGGGGKTVPHICLCVYFFLQIVTRKH